MFRSRLLISLLLLGSACYAQVPVEETEGEFSAEPTASHATVEQRVQRLEEQMRNQVEVLKKIDTLSQQVKELQGQWEVANHDITLLKDQQKSQYNDVDQRLSELSRRKTASTTESSTEKKQTVVEVTPKSGSSPESDKQKADKKDKKDKAAKADKADKAYQAAYALLKSKNYDKAQLSFQKFIRTYPHDPNLVNAHYWLGFIYLLKSQPDKAITEFKTVTKIDVNHIKTSDALDKIELARSMQGDKKTRGR
jgi:TolA-binding protein